jgi:hypothetical protein
MVKTSKSTTKEKATKTKEETHNEDELLNRELEDSFPASDPPSLTQPTIEMGGPDRKHTKQSNAGAETDPGCASTAAALQDMGLHLRSDRSVPLHYWRKE